MRARTRRALLGDQTRSLRAALRAELRRPPRVQWVDTLLFTAGVINLLLTEAVLLLRPQLFWVWYTAWAVPLLAYRYVAYTRAKWGYFLIDFCYLVNAVVFLHLYVFPRSRLGACRVLGWVGCGEGGVGG